ncbi:MAG: hydantoin racemase [Acidobacteria bacterium]|nr:hydantoin racemase [Acidobacteriota bacterium]
MFDSVFQVEVSLAILIAGALVSLAVSGRPRVCGWVTFLFAAASALSMWLAAAGAFSGAAQERTLVSLPQLGAGLTLRVDRLSAIFLAIVAVVTPASALYSIRYMEHYTSDRVAKFYPVLLLCMASMAGVLVSADWLCFLVFWESMTLTSYFLVTYERESAASQRAGLKYFIITHGATLCMVAAALMLWSRTGSFHFDAARQALSAMLVAAPLTAHLVTFLFFLGFATKAGILPMGDWLPDAHPVAPSGMSATLSGVLVKLGVYGLIRRFVSFLAPSPSLRTWGVVVALAGAYSLFAGTLTALRQTDTKRLMAFHTIGQIGYVCLGLGAGAYCLETAPAVAAICLAGAILHAINHACFKSCLFLGAGSVLFRTGTRDMDRLGGLAPFMPYTTGSTVIASLSISGMPPLNGFTSKWLIVAGCILAGLRFPLFLVLGLVALFISIVTLASFLKVLGAVFLGKADDGLTVKEVPASMLVPQVLLAALCIVLGVFPQVVLGPIGQAVAEAGGAAAAAVSTGGWWGGIRLIDGAAVAFWWPPVMLMVLVILTTLCYGIQRVARAKARSVPVWYCGEEHAPATVRYPAGSFYLPFKHAFQSVYPVARLRAPRMPAMVRRVLDLDRWLYTPAAHAIEKAADGVSRTHVGTPQVYLLWIVGGAILVTAITLMVAR